VKNVNPNGFNYFHSYKSKFCKSVKDKICNKVNAKVDKFILDSGCTDYLTNNKDLISMYIKVDEDIHTANGQPMKILGKGNIQLRNK
jgi:hypothetical protein